MVFARRVFSVAGIYGLLVLLPQYFLEEHVGRHNPPPISHAEYFYGFAGVALAWQVAFLIIARDPVRYRAIMLPGILEKLGFGVAAIVLHFQGRLPGIMLPAAVVDLLFAVLFAIAFVKTGQYEGDRVPLPMT